MPRAPLKPCAQPGCPTLTTGQRCPAHRPRPRDLRPSAAARGYDAAWARRSAAHLRRHPDCVDCSRPATQSDHAPRTRRELIAAAVADPDADEHLQARCGPCHSRKTAARDGGFGRPAAR